ncbi:amino acid ABC transporter permease [Pilibacter termitis]
MMIDALPEYLRAAQITLLLGVLGIVFSFFVGVINSFIFFFKIPILKRISAIYVELSRNTPLLIQLFFLYYGLPKLNIVLDKNIVGVIGLTFLGGGYMSEAIRSGIEEVPKIQLETGKAIGLSRLQLARYIVYPQGFTRSVSSIGANAIFLLKETSIFSAISIMDLTNVTRDLIGMYYLTKEYLLLLVISYAVILLPLAWIITLIERRMRFATFGH